MRPALRALVLACLLVAGAGMGTGASAAEPSPPGAPARAAAVKKARDHFQTGQRLYTVSRYREALEQFKNAFLEIEDPVFLYNIAQCHRLLGENAEAIRFYRRYSEASASAADQARAQRWISELESKPASTAPIATAVPAPVPPAATAGATTPGPVASGPSTESAPPPIGPLPVAPPPTAVESARPALPPTASSGLEPRAVSGESPAAVSFTAPPPASEAAPIYKRWWFWAGVGAVVLVGTVSAFAATRDRPLTCGVEVTQCTRL